MRSADSKVGRHLEEFRGRLGRTIPAIRYDIDLCWGSGERASSHQSGSRAVVGFT